MTRLSIPFVGCVGLLAAVGAIFVACASQSQNSDGTDPSGESSGANGGTGSVIVPNSAGQGTGSATGTTTPATDGSNCGSSTNKLEKKPADLLLVLDRSSSMTRAMDSSSDCEANATNCSQRWATMTTSLTAVLGNSPAEVRWGLKFYTSPGGTGTSTRRSGNCTVSSGVEVAVGPSTAAAIENQIDQVSPANYTPTRLAIEAAMAYLNTLGDGNPKYILLATDGEPNCMPGADSISDSDLAGTIAAVKAAAAAGYKVFVIGVGPETGNLTDMAQAGGTDRFYPATTPAELSSALTTIVGTVAAGCTYQIGQAPPANPNAIGVYLDKALVPQNATNGWSYDAANAAIVINGSYCSDLQNGVKKLVEIYLPCDTAGPLPPVIL